jgi:hypothetical protein
MGNENLPKKEYQACPFAYVCKMDDDCIACSECGSPPYMESADCERCHECSIRQHG